MVQYLINIIYFFRLTPRQFSIDGSSRCRKSFHLVLMANRLQQGTLVPVY